MLEDSRLRANRVVAALAAARPGVALDPSDELVFLNVSPAGNLIVEMATGGLPIDVSAEDFSLAPGESFKVKMEVLNNAQLAFQVLCDPPLPFSSYAFTYMEASDASYIDMNNSRYEKVHTDLDATPTYQVLFNTRDLVMDPARARFAPCMPIVAFEVKNNDATATWNGRILTVFEGGVTFL